MIRREQSYLQRLPRLRLRVWTGTLRTTKTGRPHRLLQNLSFFLVTLSTRTSRTTLVTIWTSIEDSTGETIKAIVSEGYTSDCVGLKSSRSVSFFSYRSLAIFFTYDDHEFVNDYAGSSRDLGPYLNGSRAFLEYNAQTNFDSPDENQLYYEFSYGPDAAFFVFDTRRHRSTLDVEEENRTMLGAQQLGTFLRWLSKVRPKLTTTQSASLMTQVNSTSTFKFVITSVPLTSLWTNDATVDSWTAYTVEKATILDAIATVPNVIILSGDRHEFALVEFNHLSSTSHRTLEVSTSPLSMCVNAVRILRSPRC